MLLCLNARQGQRVGVTLGGLGRVVIGGVV